jgi:periplasmic mercuric ion binding protein
MKAKVFGLTTLILLSVFTVMAGNKTEKFKVNGNCGMCETRIEKAAKGVPGVTSADWNKDTKMMVVSFNDAKTDIHKVHQAVAKAGHDTSMQKADNATYNKLHSCCKYERVSLKEEKSQTGNPASKCPVAKTTGCCG